MAAAQVNQMAARSVGDPCWYQRPIKRESPTQGGGLGVASSSYWRRATMQAIQYIAIPQRRHDGRSQKQPHIGRCPATGMEPAPRAMPPIPKARMLRSQGHAVQRLRLLLDRESIGPKSKMGCIKITRHAILAPCRRLVESYTGDSSLSRAAGPIDPSFASAGTDPNPPNFSAIAFCASLPHHVA